MNENYHNFYNMVENWTVSDYCTPGIKAEVILDMLISEFIEDLVRYHYFMKENKIYKVTLLIKEFPIQIYDENKLNAKVDYLVSVENKKLVLVELKSTHDSYSSKQEERMKKAVDMGVENLISFYHQIVKSKKGNSLDRKKYQYAFGKFNKNLIKAQFDEQKVKKTEYLYISLIDNNKLPENKLILKEYFANPKFKNTMVDEGHQQLWKNVSDILLKCVEELEKECAEAEAEVE